MNENRNSYVHVYLNVFSISDSANVSLRYLSPFPILTLKYSEYPHSTSFLFVFTGSCFVLFLFVLFFSLVLCIFTSTMISSFFRLVFLCSPVFPVHIITSLLLRTIFDLSFVLSRTYLIILFLYSYICICILYKEITIHSVFSLREATFTFQLTLSRNELSSHPRRDKRRKRHG